MTMTPVSFGLPRAMYQVETCTNVSHFPVGLGNSTENLPEFSGGQTMLRHVDMDRSRTSHRNRCGKWVCPGVSELRSFTTTSHHTTSPHNCAYCIGKLFPWLIGSFTPPETSYPGLPGFICKVIKHLTGLSCIRTTISSICDHPENMET